MSTLQVSLAIIGGLILAGVVAYNAWVTRRNLPRTVRDSTTDPAPAPSASGERPGAAAMFADTAPGADQHGRIDPVLDDEAPTRPAALDDADPVAPPARCRHRRRAPPPWRSAPWSVGRRSARRSMP